MKRRGSSAGGETARSLFRFERTFMDREKDSLRHSKRSCTRIFRILSASIVHVTKYCHNLRAYHRGLNPLIGAARVRKCVPCSMGLRNFAKAEDDVAQS